MRSNPSETCYVDFLSVSERILVEEHNATFFDEANLKVQHCASCKAVCFDAVIQKSEGYTGDVNDRRALRDVMYKQCGVISESISRYVTLIGHGVSSAFGVGRVLSNSKEVASVLAEVAESYGLVFQEVVDMAYLSFCEQVEVMAKSRLFIGIIGGAVGGNIFNLPDSSVAMEFTACSISKQRDDRAILPDCFSLAYEDSCDENQHRPRHRCSIPFSPHFNAAEKYGIGYLEQCLCTGASTDLTVDARDPEKGWWSKSANLTLDLVSLRATARALLRGDYEAARAHSAPRCY